MWKKICIAAVTFISAVSAGYAYFSIKMNAAVANNIAQLNQGDRVILGMNASNQEVHWDVHVDNGSTYTLSTPKIDRVQACTANTNNYLHSGNEIGYCDFHSTISGKDDSPVYTVAKQFDDTFFNSNQNNGFEQSEIVNQSSVSVGGLKHTLIPSPAQLTAGGMLGITSRSQLLGRDDTGFALSGKVYDLLGASYGYGVSRSFFRPGYDMPGGTAYSEWVEFEWAFNLSNNPTTGGWQMVDVVPFLQMKKGKIVSVLDVNYHSGTLYDIASQGNTFKIRYEDSAYSVSFQDIKLNGKIVSGGKVVKNSVVTLDATANDSLAVYVFDQSGVNLLYYQVLNNTKDFDLTALPVGTYKIAVASEEFNDMTNRPAKSSPLSSMKDLEIVEPHQIAYTKQPQSGATLGDYEFSKNVNAGQTVGKIAVNPQGAVPLTYTVESNGDDTYQNFEIDGLNSGGTSNSTSLDVKIKSSAPDLGNGGLKAGTYQFCISAQDGNGYPTTPSTNDNTKVCTSFTVVKTNPTIIYDDSLLTKKSIAQATSGWSETATATPNTGTKITYAKSAGVVGLIDYDKDSGAISYKGGTGFGKITLKATADDDPNTGYDNYNSASTTKEIVIYREVDGSVSPNDKLSFQTSDANIKPNGVIGTIVGKLGTPDDASTTEKTTYTYGLKNVDDYNYFSVDSSTGKITTIADLSATTGSYNITVTVSDNWSTKEIPVTIDVGLAPAENLQFYESPTSNTVINTKTVNFTETSVSVFATVKGSSNTNPVTYKVQDGSTNVITINQNTGAVTVTGTGTVTIVAEKQGASGQADAQATLTFTVTAGAQDFIYTTDSTHSTERPKTGNYYNALVETYAPNKTFNVYTAGNPTGSNVTYQLKAGSPTDVISVDSDGTIHILNASTNVQKGKVIVQAISQDPSGNYDDKIIELPIDIDKGTRTIAFAENPVTVINGTGTVTPNILVDGVLDTSGTTVIEVDSKENSIAWTNDGATIQYSWNDASGKNIKLHATKSADRNYKAAEVDGTLHILGADENVLTLSTPGKITYGDHFTIRSTQDDSASTNVQYKFETDNGVFISAPKVNGNIAEFDALASSGSTKIKIKVTRTADGELPMSKTIEIQVLPKPITITIDDKEKKRLEENPTLTYQDFTSQLVTWNGVRDNVDTTHIKLTTTATKFSPIGSYPIKAGSAEKQLNDNYPNYTFTIKDGKLNVKDNGDKNFWDEDNDGCPDFNIPITDDDGNTITINGDRNEDGIPDYNIDTDGDGKPDLNIDTDNDGKPDLNLVILKDWKPSKCVEIGDIKYSTGINAKPEINVDLDGDMIPDINIDTNGDFKADYNIDNDGDGKADVNIGKVHTPWKPDKDFTYKGFAYDTMKQDQPLVNVDSDGDGRPDVNIDLDGDGTPDINIDHDGDGIPDTDIDSDGDGKPDINVDTDGDGKPDENIKEITEWKPEHNVDGDVPYDTMDFDESKKPDDVKDPDNDKDPNDSNNEDPDTDVKGSYYPGDNTGGAQNTGGALTGDTTNMMMYMGLGCMSIGMMLLIVYKRKQED